MLGILWKELIYKPLYNGLLFFTNAIPNHDIGIAIVILTITIKIALFPQSRNALHAQEKMKGLEGDLSAIKEKHKDDQKKIAEETMKLYKERGVNPVSGCFPMLIQIPFIMGLYLLFQKGIGIHPELLYPFIPPPESLNTLFLGFLDLTQKNLPLALLAGGTQFIQAWMMSSRGPESKGPAKNTQEEFARAMQMQMKYVFPVMITFIAYRFSAAVALYWAVGNMVSIVLDWWARRSLPTHTQKI